MVKHIIKNFGLSISKSCKLTQLPRSTYTYVPKENNDSLIISLINEILSKPSCTKYGCEMIHLKLRQQGMIINYKGTRKIYKEQGLQLKTRKRRKKIASEKRIKSELPTEPQKLWAMDFIHDSVETVIDPVSNVSPLIYVDHSITGKKLVDILEINI